MAVPISEFWKLLEASKIASAAAIGRLQEQFAAVKGASEQGNSNTLAAWLVAQRVISSYQAKVLKSGRAGPFIYGDYLVYGRHAEGRLKRTFRAIHLSSRHRVLLAFFSGPAVETSWAWSTVAKQMELFSRASSPHVARLFQVCDLGSYKFAVLEDLTGNTAAERIAKAALTWPKAARIVRQAALGSARLLELGYVHGDVRPDNIWLDRDRNARLLIPPLARDPMEIPGPMAVAAAQPGPWLQGAADYLAPEVSQSQGGLTPQTEVYALGCTLYHLMIGRPPFAGKRLADKLALHAHGEPPVVGDAAPPEAANIVAAAMHKNPAKRYQHPLEMADALTSVLERFARNQLAIPPSEPAKTLAAYEGWLRDQPIVPTIDVVDDRAAVAPPPGPLEVGGFGPLAAEAHQPMAAPLANFPAEISTSGIVSGDVPDVANVLAAADVQAPIAAAAAQPAAFEAPLAAPDPRNRILERYQPASKRKRGRIVAAIVGVCLLAAGGAWMVMGDGTPGIPQTAGVAAEEEKAADPAGAATASGEETAASDRTESNSGPMLVADDGATLWVSPTEGNPIAIDYLVPGIEWLLFVRPAELTAHAEGSKVLAALGPKVERWQRELEAASGAALAEMEHVLLASIDRMSQESAMLTVVRYVKPPPRDKLLASWGGAPSEMHGEEEFFSTPTGAAWFPAKEAGKTIVVGPRELVIEAAARAGNRPFVHREMEKMLLTSDASRTATFIFDPTQLIASVVRGSESAGEQFLTQAATFFSSARGAAVSAVLTNEDFFGELRVQGPLEQPPEEVAKVFRDRMANIPLAVDAYLASFVQSAHSRLLLRRFPLMLREAEQYTRGGVDQNQAVLRCYLPAAAAHNLALGAELTLAESSAAVNSLASDSPGATAPKSVVERLGQSTSLRFANEPLERALRTLADDIGVAIDVIGGDLELEGITRNQAIVDLDERDRPAREIFQTIMLKANPDGKLVYVIRPGEGGNETLVITTRAAAEKRGDPLPPEFAQP